MNEKYRLTKHGTYIYDMELEKKIYNWMNDSDEIVTLLNQLYEENKTLHQKLFEERTKNAYIRTVLKKDKEYYTADEFIEELEKW